MRISEEKARKLKAGSTIFGCVLIIFTFGNFYSVGKTIQKLKFLGNMSPYIISFIRKRVDPNVKLMDAIWLSGVCLGIQGIFMPIAGLLALKVGIRVVIAVSCLLNSGAVMVSYISIQWGYIFLVTTYSLCVGISIAASYSILLSLATAWVPKSRGMVLGLCACGFGAGSVILTPIQTILINPQNIKANNESHLFDDETIISQVPISIFYIGCLLATLQLIGMCCIRVPSSNDSYEDEVMNEEREAENYSPLKMLHTIEFYVLWIINFCGIFPVVMIMSMYKIIGQKEIKNDRYLTVVGSLGSVANMLGRLFWGKLADVIFYKKLMLTVFVFWGGLFMVLPFVARESRAGMYLFATNVILLFLCLSGLFVLLPFSTRKLFGQDYFAANYGLVFSSVLPSAMIGSAITVVGDIEHHILHLCFGCAFSSFAGLLATLVLPQGQRRGPRNITTVMQKRRASATAQPDKTDAQQQAAQT